MTKEDILKKHGLGPWMQSFPMIAVYVKEAMDEWAGEVYRPKTNPDQFVKWLEEEIKNASMHLKKFAGAIDEDEISELKYWYGHKVASESAKNHFQSLITDSKPNTNEHY